MRFLQFLKCFFHYTNEELFRDKKINRFLITSNFFQDIFYYFIKIKIFFNEESIYLRLTRNFVFVIFNNLMILRKELSIFFAIIDVFLVVLTEEMFFDEEIALNESALNETISFDASSSNKWSSSKSMKDEFSLMINVDKSIFDKIWSFATQKFFVDAEIDNARRFKISTSDCFSLERIIIDSLINADVSKRRSIFEFFDRISSSWKLSKIETFERTTSWDTSSIETFQWSSSREISTIEIFERTSSWEMLTNEDSTK